MPKQTDIPAPPEPFVFREEIEARPGDMTALHERSEQALDRLKSLLSARFGSPLSARQDPEAPLTLSNEGEDEYGVQRYVWHGTFVMGG